MEKKELLKFWRVDGSYHFYCEEYETDYTTYEKAKEQFDRNKDTDDITTLTEITIYEKDGYISINFKILEEKENKV